MSASSEYSSSSPRASAPGCWLPNGALDQIGDLRVALAGHGDLQRLRDLPPSLQAGVTALLGPREGARVWVSATPFVLPRYPKRRGANTIEGQVVAELVTRELPAASVEVLPWDEKTRDLRHAVRVRRRPAKRPPIDMGFAVRLTFETPVKGPLVLGYGSHFGLGLFVATAADIEAAGRATDAGVPE